MPNPGSELSLLRRIGWELWDPIALRDIRDWRVAAPDEYDGYLIHAAAMLRGGATPAQVAAYLFWIEREHMAQHWRDDTAARATAAALAEAIAPRRG